MQHVQLSVTETTISADTYPLHELEEYAGATLQEAGGIDGLVEAVRDRAHSSNDGWIERPEKSGIVRNVGTS